MRSDDPEVNKMKEFCKKLKKEEEESMRKFISAELAPTPLHHLQPAQTGTRRNGERGLAPETSVSPWKI